MPSMDSERLKKAVAIVVTGAFALGLFVGMVL